LNNPRSQSPKQERAPIGARSKKLFLEEDPYRLFELFFRLLFFAELRLFEVALAIVWCRDDP
jgi:hypothetical protein